MAKRTYSAIQHDLESLLRAHATTPDPDFNTKQDVLIAELRDAQTDDPAIAAAKLVTAAQVQTAVEHAQNHVLKNLDRRDYQNQRSVRDIMGNAQLLNAIGSAGMGFTSGMIQVDERDLRRIGIRIR